MIFNFQRDRQRSAPGAPTAFLASCGTLLLRALPQQDQPEFLDQDDISYGHRMIPPTLLHLSHLCPGEQRGGLLFQHCRGRHRQHLVQEDARNFSRSRDDVIRLKRASIPCARALRSSCLIQMIGATLPCETGLLAQDVSIELPTRKSCRFHISRNEKDGNGNLRTRMQEEKHA